jgi:hypothetical protein
VLHNPPRRLPSILMVPKNSKKKRNPLMVLNRLPQLTAKKPHQVHSKAATGFSNLHLHSTSG